MLKLAKYKLLFFRKYVKICAGNILYKICIKTGKFTVTLTASNSGGSNTFSVTNFITVYQSPVAPTISLHGDTLVCSYDPSYASYQWYDSTALIPNATDTFLVIHHASNYNVKVTGRNGWSIAVGIVAGIKELNDDDLQFTMYDWV